MDSRRFQKVGPRRRIAMAGGVLAAAASLAAAGHAQAQTQTTVGVSQDVERTKETRPQSQYPLYISYNDCKTDNDLVFTVTLTNFDPSNSLEVWVGENTDCRQVDNRVGGNARCKPVFSQSDLQQTMTVQVSAKDVAKAVGVSDCDDRRNNTAPRPTALYFLYLQTANDETAAGVEWTESRVDLLGPPAPTNLEVGVGEGRLLVTYDATEADVARGFRFYCAEATDTGTTGTTGSGTGGSGAGAGGGAGTGGAGGAGVAGGAGGAGGAGVAGGGGDAGGAAAGGATGAGGAGGASGTGGGGDGGSSGEGGSSSGGSCTTDAFAANQILPADSPYACGSTTVFSGYAGEMANGDKLQNGIPYAVAVAGYDDVGNVGKLSAPVCGTPQNVDDFFEVYRELGGLAGGGFCSVNAIGARSETWAAMGAIAAGLALGARRLGRRGGKNEGAR